MKAPLLFFFTFVAALLTPASAQDSFTLAWSSISGGGGASTEASEFTLGGSSVGQMTAGDASAEPGAFSVTSGYWTFPFEPLDLHLAMTLNGGTVTLTWDAGGPPAVLESSSDLQLWTPMDPQPSTPFFQEAESMRKFYRLTPGAN